MPHERHHLRSRRDAAQPTLDPPPPNIRGKPQLFPGVENCLRGLHADGFQLGLCTNKLQIPTRAVLDHFGVLELFSGFSYGDGPYPRKPDAAPVRHVIGQLRARRFLFVGNSKNDAAAAQNAGLAMAIYTGGYRNKTPVGELPHDARFDHFDQLRGIIDRLARCRSNGCLKARRIGTCQRS